MDIKKDISVGIIGTGFIARGLCLVLRNDPELVISSILTRRKPGEICDPALGANKITNSVNKLIDSSDIVVECSGDPVYATEVLIKVMEAGIPVVTMDSDLHVTTGSWLAKRGFITEAEGDQPGSMAAFLMEILQMGFSPLVLGNIKGFLNHDPTSDEMKYWSKRNGISLQQVTAFTDGTKIQIEQTLIANVLGANIFKQGMCGVQCEDYRDGAMELADIAAGHGICISDFVLSPKSPPGIFIAATHSDEQAPHLKYLKLGEGPYYILTRPFHLCHLEIPKTIRNVLNNKNVLLNNSENPVISVAAVAKRKLLRGEIIKRGIGSFSVRGEAVRISEHPDHIPIGLLSDAVVKREIEPGRTIEFDDAEIPESKALIAWMETNKTLPLRNYITSV